VRFRWIGGQRGHYPLSALCGALGVTRAGYYAWRTRRQSPPGPRRRRRAELVERIRAAHEASRCTYGSPRVCHELRAQGVSVCENTVAKLMRHAGIRSKVRRRFRVRTTDAGHEHPVAPNVLNRDFAAAAPDRKWAADITYVPTDQGWLYLAVVLDLCSRRVVGWAMAEHLRAALCADALEMALLGRRAPAPAAAAAAAAAEGLVHHSDRGVQYACGAYRGLLRSHGIACSMSRAGDCYDNAVVESFFKTLKAELVYHEHYATRAQARRSVFEYVEVFYNRKRRHSSLGYKSPEQFEAAMN
jgi:transposase InsO family protein